MKRRFALFVGVILASAIGQASTTSNKTTIIRSGTEIALANDALQIVIDAKSGRPVVVRLINKLAGRTIPILSDDFALGLEGRQPLRSADFALQQTREESLPGGRRLVFHLAAHEPAVELDLVYEMHDADFFLRRWLRVSPAKPLSLREVNVWRMGVAGKAAHQGYGEPIFLDDTFWGLEFPGGVNAYADGMLSLTQHPGRAVAEPWTSKTAVVGVAEPTRVQSRFLTYVKTFQATPKDLKLFVNYNTWWTLMPPDERNCLALIELFRKKLFLPYGASIDTFTIDCGWNNPESLWAISKDRFPNGFAPVRERLRSIHANLGLWLSPSSWYGQAAWCVAHGYAANSSDGWLCQSAPKYRRDLRAVLANLAKQNDIAFWKFDGFMPTCEKTGHGHLPGNFAKEANIDAYIEHITAAQQRGPALIST